MFNAVLSFDLADAKIAAPPTIASINQRSDADSSAVDIAADRRRRRALLPRGEELRRRRRLPAGRLPAAMNSNVSPGALMAGAGQAGVAAPVALEKPIRKVRRHRSSPRALRRSRQRRLPSRPRSRIKPEPMPRCAHGRRRACRARDGAGGNRRGEGSACGRDDGAGARDHRARDA